MTSWCCSHPNTCIWFLMLGRWMIWAMRRAPFTLLLNNWSSCLRGDKDKFETHKLTSWMEVVTWWRWWWSNLLLSSAVQLPQPMWSQHWTTNLHVTHSSSMTAHAQEEGLRKDSEVYPEQETDMALCSFKYPRSTLLLFWKNYDCSEGMLLLQALHACVCSRVCVCVCVCVFLCVCLCVYVF